MNAEVDGGALSDLYHLVVELFLDLGHYLLDAGRVDTSVGHQLEERQAARKAKDYARADAIRNQLKDMGFAVEDTANGPKLKKLQA